MIGEHFAGFGKRLVVEGGNDIVGKEPSFQGDIEIIVAIGVGISSSQKSERAECHLRYPITVPSICVIKLRNCHPTLLRYYRTCHFLENFVSLRVLSLADFFAFCFLNNLV